MADTRDLQQRSRGNASGSDAGKGEAGVDDIALLQSLSAQVTGDRTIAASYDDLLNAAVAIMGSDFASMQMLERRPDGDELDLLAHHGFSQDAAALWRTVRLNSATTCGRALRTGQRTIVRDVERCDFLVGSDDLAMFRRLGMRSMQSTPLVSRGGDLLGMISTHWRRPHEPSEHDFRLLDILARQAADIIEHTRTGEAMRRTMQFNEAIMAHMGEGLYTVDGEGLVTTMNPAAERLLGWTLEELRGRRMHDATHYQHRDGTPFPAEECAGFGVLRHGRTLTNYEDVFIRKDGTFIDVVYSSAPLRNGSGVTGLVVVFHDATERRRAEQDRVQLLEREREVRAAAEAANRLKDEFLATISHELRTPLNAIVGWAAMLERAAPPDPRVLKGLQSINRNTHTLAKLVDDVLDVSRIISGKMRLEVTSLDLGNVVDSAVEAVLPAATAKDITIHVSIDPAARSMTGDPTRLQQAIWNLLSNAIKFTPRGGSVSVSTRSGAGEIEISVVDSGIGIDPGFLPYVFDRFRQADASSTRPHTGLGLGLAIVRHLVELHGGSVRACSHGPNTGATFSMSLPLRHAAPDSRPGPEPTITLPAPAPTAPMHRVDDVRILVVDDDQESCDVMAEMLRRRGASVRAAMSAAEALEALNAFPADVILTDIGMPGQDGYTVLREGRAAQTRLGRHVPIVAVTAYARADDRERALKAGFDDYVTKPVDPAALVATVVALVGAGASSD